MFNDQAAALLAAWVAGTGAASITVLCRSDIGASQAAFATMIPALARCTCQYWHQLEDFAAALTGPCSQHGLDCRVDTVPHACGGDTVAVVMQRLV